MPHIGYREVVAQLLHLYQELLSLQSLAPGDRVNSLFSEFVRLCVSSVDPVTIHLVLNDPAIQQIKIKLRSLCATGEFLLEVEWSRKLMEEQQRASKQASLCRLSKFVYYDNYEALVRLEWHAQQGINAKLRRVVFIGSGPLPLSSMLMILLSNGLVQQIDSIDKSDEATEASRASSKSLALDRHMVFREQEPLAYHNYSEADVIILGALVTNKENLLRRLAHQMKPGAVLWSEAPIHSARYCTQSSRPMIFHDLVSRSF